jgi:hypothetical protein
MAPMSFQATATSVATAAAVSVLTSMLSPM